jgi:hypothetical protein
MLIDMAQERYAVTHAAFLRQWGKRRGFTTKKSQVT